MKKVAMFISLFFISSIIFSCKEKQEIEIITNTIEYEIFGRPLTWLKHKDKYYCFFERGFGNFLTPSTNHFYVLNEKGKVETKVPVPEGLDYLYIDLFVRNDSIFTIEYMYKNTFYLDLDKNQWVETKKADDLIYEDDDFYVTALNFGEWGATTWFRDKKINIQYELASTTPIINKLDGIYYLTESQNIIEVKNPKELLESKLSYNYKNATTELHIQEGSHSLKGSEFIFQDSTFSWFSKFDIATSFVANNNLYHIYRDSIGTKIGKLINKQLVSVNNDLSEIRPYRNYFNYRNRISKNDYQTVQFLTEDENICGIIEIENGRLKVNYFKNVLTAHKMKKNKDEKWFTKVFSLYFSKFDNLTLNQIQSIEQKENAIDYTSTRRAGNLFDETNDLEIPETYVKLIEPDKELLTRYYYTKENEKESFKVISFVWYKSKKGKGKPIIPNKTEKDIGFVKKADYVRNFLTKELGEPFSEEVSEYSANLFWRKNGKKVWFSDRGDEVIVQIIQE